MVQVLIVYKLLTKISLLQNPREIIAFMSILTISELIFDLARKSYTRGSLSGPEKFFEGVYSHVMKLIRKCDFGPDFDFESGPNRRFELT